MNKKEIIYFVEHNEREQVKEYFDLVLEKLKNSYERINKVILLTLILILLYSLIDEAVISGLDIGPFSFTEVTFILKITPIAFSYLLLLIASYTLSINELYDDLKIMSLKLYRIEMPETSMKGKTINNFIKTITPFSYDWKYQNLPASKFFHLITYLLKFPLACLIVFLYYKEYVWIKTLIVEHWENSFSAKAAIIITIWLSLTSMVYYFLAIYMHFRVQKEESREEKEFLNQAGKGANKKTTEE